MKVLSKKTCGFVLYAVVITGVFLYLLFPSDIVKSRLEASAVSAELTVKMDAVRPALPLGLTFNNLHVASLANGQTYLDSESLTARINPLSFFQKKKKLGLSGKAYGGTFKGSLRLASWEKMASPLEGDIRFADMDVAKLSFLRVWLVRNVTGKASGHWVHKASDNTGRDLSATCDVTLKKGSFPLQESFLGATRIDFETSDIRLQFKGGVIRVEKLRMIGPQMECSLSGDITPMDDVRQSALNLKGEIILVSNKTKLNVTVGGTLENPLLRYL